MLPPFPPLLRLSLFLSLTRRHETLADDALILEKPLDVVAGEKRNFFAIEAAKRVAKSFSLRQDGSPAKPGLKTFKARSELEDQLTRNCSRGSARPGSSS
jgi:hypothetical protein